SGRDEYLAKIRAAAAARSDPAFLLIARTDSRAVIGFEEAVTRMNAALEAGADMAFLEAPQTPEEVAAVPRLVKGPCLLNVVSGGKTPVLDLAEAQKLGFKLAILPGLLFQTAVPAFDAILAEVKATQRHPDMKVSIKDKFRRMGSDEWDALCTRFRDDAGASGSGVKTAAEESLPFRGRDSAHRIHRRLAAEHAGDVARAFGLQLLERLDRIETSVRREDHVRAADERRILRERLGSDHVEGSGTEVTGVERGDECRLVHQRA